MWRRLKHVVFLANADGERLRPPLGAAPTSAKIATRIASGSVGQVALADRQGWAAEVDASSPSCSEWAFLKCRRSFSNAASGISRLRYNQPCIVGRSTSAIRMRSPFVSGPTSSRSTPTSLRSESNGLGLFSSPPDCRESGAAALVGVAGPLDPDGLAGFGFGDSFCFDFDTLVGLSGFFFDRCAAPLDPGLGESADSESRIHCSMVSTL